ncbi:hypothetical protein DL95DRAFT_397995 [Leptodontidium sp. 2 PMI_412]|nr:hypothetical protein DL95DRAFT_397995 [Leptodontidium sp. 2 PMI_412]
MVAIVTKDYVIPQETAEAAFRSLDEEVGRKKREGALDAGKLSSVGLEWTVETHDAVRAFEAALKANFADIAPIQSLGGKPVHGKLNIARPIVYSDVSTEPKWAPSSALGYGIIGIIALGTLQLPEIGDNGPATIESGSVVYYRDSSPIVFRACKGRGIMFYIS